MQSPCKFVTAQMLNEATACLPILHASTMSTTREISNSVERLQLVSLHRSFILVQVCEWVLGTVVMCIIVCIDRLSFEPGNSVELLDGGSTQTSECPEHGTLDLGDLSILDGIDKSV